MLLCSLSESMCFFLGRGEKLSISRAFRGSGFHLFWSGLVTLGALSTMPAVKTFALYAALAVLMDFILQMTAFVALLSLDARRQDSSRCELLCCVTVSSKRPNTPNEGFLLPLMRKYYAPVLLNQYTRVIVVRLQP